MPANPIATRPLDIDGTRAYNPGDEVPADVVQAHGWQDATARPGTKAAEKAADG